MTEPQDFLMKSGQSIYRAEKSAIEGWRLIAGSIAASWMGDINAPRERTTAPLFEIYMAGGEDSAQLCKRGSAARVTIIAAVAIAVGRLYRLACCKR